MAMKMRWTKKEAEPLVPAMEELLEEIRKETNSVTVHMSLVEQPTRMPFRFKAVGKYANVYEDLKASYPDRLASSVLSECKLIYLPNVQESESWEKAKAVAIEESDKAYSDYLDCYRSELAIPIVDSHNAINGIINLHRAEEGRATRERVEELAETSVTDALEEAIPANGNSKKLAKMVNEYAFTASRAVENAVGYFQAKGEPTYRYDLLLKVAKIIGELHDQVENNRVCELFTQKARQVSFAEIAALWMLHEPTKELYLAAFDSIVPLSSDATMRHRTPLSKSIRAKVLDTAKSEYCPDTENEPLWSKCIIGVRSCYCIPLVMADMVIGVLCVDSFRLDAFDSEVRTALDRLMEGMAAVWDKAMRISETVMRDNYAPRLIKSRNEEELCQNAIYVIPSLVKAESASLFLARKRPSKPGLLSLAATTGLAIGFDSNPTYSFGEGITGWVAMYRMPLRLRNCGDVAELRRWGNDLKWKGKTREAPTAIGYRRPLLVVPVLDDENECLGVLRASGTRSGLEFTQQDSDLLQKFARLFYGELSEVRKTVRPQSNECEEDYLLQLLWDCKAACGADAATFNIVEKDQLLNVAYIGELLVPSHELSTKIERDTVTAQSVRWKKSHQPCFVDTQSELAAPSLVEGENLAESIIVGVLNLESREIDYFTNEHRARAEKYAGLAARYLAKLRHEGKWTRLVNRLLNQNKFQRELPDLLKSHPEHWVAYHDDTRIGPERDLQHLYELCEQLGHQPNECFVRKVVHEILYHTIGPRLVDD